MSELHYYPFGSPMNARSISTDEYRFGFNGMEKDDEVKGAGNSYGFQYRFYDNRLGRFLSIDPVGREFPWYSSYQFAGNKPIWAFDLGGLEDIAYVYKMQGKDRVLIKTVDYRKMTEQTGPLGHGVYAQIINEQGDKFSEAFIPSENNSIGKFSNGGVNRKNFTYLDIRLNALLIEKTVEMTLVNDLGFEKTQVEKDVEPLETDEPGFTGKFATIREGSVEKYTKDFTPRKFSEPHKSKEAKGSGKLGTAPFLELKYYDGAESQTDGVPNHIDFVQSSTIPHLFEAFDVWVEDKFGGDPNLGAYNAKRYKDKVESK